ncbi:MAG: transglycosylase SLT domain-containing protein [Nitrospirota bacterium]
MWKRVSSLSLLAGSAWFLFAGAVPIYAGPPEVQAQTSVPGEPEGTGPDAQSGDMEPVATAVATPSVSDDAEGQAVSSAPLPESGTPAPPTPPAESLENQLPPVPVSTAAALAASDSLYNIPVVRDHKVEGHLRYFHTTIRSKFEQWLTRLGRYKPQVERIFSEFDLPSDLIFLSLVESGFNPNAYSRARATGPWQFMKGTAKLYGLRVDQYVDERRDPIKSTVAAARYLRDLYDLFGTWPLAMAAYNAGEGKVLRALQKSSADSFSEIAETRHIRRETKEYVPRIMAATIIAKNPAEFGFSLDEPVLHEFEEVVVHRAVHLREVAQVAGLSFAELKRLNPELRRDVTPPDDSEYHLKVPVGTRTLVGQKLAQVPTWKPPARFAKISKRKGHAESADESSGWYRVRVGDSLWTIAKRFRVSVRELKELNNLSGRRIRIKPGDLLAIR